MKLSNIFSLVLGCCSAIGIVASTSPAHALAWTFNLNFNDGAVATGSFDYNGGIYSNINITVSGGITTAAGKVFNDADLVGSAGNNFAVQNSGGTDFFYLQNNRDSDWSNPLALSYGQIYAQIRSPGIELNPSASGIAVAPQVPWHSDAGAAIPVGSLLLLGAMRKVKKRVASNICILNPETGKVS
ncbi:hypothetical protein [Chlorogloeopsis sp. ULAP02]|uniref:hypothetical protein n=1 Tax=Chlorogloeopsis sp. ULAP02 TaxID=3107926 RepID=UPI0031355D89